MVERYWQVQLPIRVSQFVIQIIHLGCGLIQINLFTVMNGCKEKMMETRLFFQLIERAMELFM